MTKAAGSGRITAEGCCCMKRRLATPLGKGVKLMWRRRLYIVLRFLVCLVFWACILTMKVC